MHGIKTRRQNNSISRLGLKGWYTRKRKMRVDAQIREILNIHRAAETADIAENHVMLPPVWGHKTEALTGDTIYLAHNNSIRSFILSALDRTEPEEGKVSISSPIGRALVGRHQGDKVRLMTLDGELDYTILKII